TNLDYNNLAFHLKQECLFNFIKCSKCKQLNAQCKQQEHEKEECPFTEIIHRIKDAPTCPFKIIKRLAYNNHISHCPHMEIQCPKCSFPFLRKNLSLHQCFLFNRISTNCISWPLIIKKL